MEVSGAGLDEVLAEYETTRLGCDVDGEQYLAADAGWFRGIVAGVVARQKSLDPTINRALTPDWPLARIEVLLRAILRAATFELTERPDVPHAVVIDEYVDVAHAFFDDDVAAMVNGVLDRIAHGRVPGDAPGGSGS